MASFGSFCMFCHHKKKQRNQTLEFSLGGLLFGCIVSFVVRNLCLGHRAHRSYLLVFSLQHYLLPFHPPLLDMQYQRQVHLHLKAVVDTTTNALHK